MKMIKAKDNFIVSMKGMSYRHWLKVLIVAIACFVFVFYLVSCSRKDAETSQSNPTPTQTPYKLVKITTTDFSTFKHESSAHERLPCLLCHKREDNSPKLKLSGHVPCSGCHTEQFADNKNQICTICHTDAEKGSVKEFPALGSFNVLFEHAKHLKEANCTVCHKPSRMGVALSMPTGLNAHATCFQCHEPQKEIGDRNIGSCGVCHQPGSPNRKSDFAKAYTVNFSHAEHGQRQNLNCMSCHSVQAGMAKGRQVSAPLASMHFAPKRAQSCASCHNNKRTFGGDDFSSCRRCHQGKNFGLS